MEHETSLTWTLFGCILVVFKLNLSLKSLSGSNVLLQLSLIWLSDSSGRKRTWMCASLQNLSLYGTDVAYVITTSTSMRYLMNPLVYRFVAYSQGFKYRNSLR